VLGTVCDPSYIAWITDTWLERLIAKISCEDYPGREGQGVALRLSTCMSIVVSSANPDWRAVGISLIMANIPAGAAVAIALYA